MPWLVVEIQRNDRAIKKRNLCLKIIGELARNDRFNLRLFTFISDPLLVLLRLEIELQ